MDIHQLKVFVSVYKNRSFSRASEDLYLSQPTISDHIKSLEETLNSRLFDRLGRSIAPTKEAMLLYPRALDLIERLESIRSAVKNSKEEMEGEVLIGASTVPGAYVLPRLASDFKAIYPGAFFNVKIEDSREITRQVAEHELLLGIVGARMEWKTLRFVPFMADEMVLAAKPGLCGKNPVTLDDLKGLPLLLREEGSGTRRMTEQFLTEKGLPFEKLRITDSFGSTAAIKEALKAGSGASILSRIAIKEEMERGAIEEIRIKGVRMTRNFYIIMHRKRTFPKLLDLFFGFLKDRCACEVAA